MVERRVDASVLVASMDEFIAGMNAISPTPLELHQPAGWIVEHHAEVAGYHVISGCRTTTVQDDQTGIAL